MSNPILNIKMKNQNVIQIELFPNVTPNSVHSIISLAKKGLYDNRRFYRIVKDFVLQTDCEKTPEYDHGCDYIIDGEYKESGYDVEQPIFTKGIVGMAGLGGKSNTSSGSSFFIMTGEFPRLDGNFAVVGKVISGMDEVERLNNVPCDDKMFGEIQIFEPLEPEIMETVTIETFGIEYPAPNTKPYNEATLKREEELKELRKKEAANEALKK